MHTNERGATEMSICCLSESDESSPRRDDEEKCNEEYDSRTSESEYRYGFEEVSVQASKAAKPVLGETMGEEDSRVIGSKDNKVDEDK